jgi:uncharacterized protein YbaP (TraB family)
MKLRHASLLVALLAVGAACKGSAQAPDRAPGGSAAPGPATATAPGADPWAKPAAKKDPLAHPLFWSIEKDGKTTYILGTMHMGVDPETRIPDLVWKRLDEAPAFAMETNLDDASKLDVMRGDGSTLHAELGDAYWKKLEDALGSDKATGLDRMKAMMPATLLSMRGLPETAAMDGVLYGRATREHKRIVFLEPFEKEAAVLEKWMDSRAIKEMLDDLPGGERHSKEMLAAYLAGDADTIEKLSDAERADFKKAGRTDAEYDEQMADLLYGRNASWIDPIEQLHASGGGFIAVGAMHLIGAKSVLDLLQHKGYKVARITP